MERTRDVTHALACRLAMCHGKKNPCAQRKEMSYGEVVISERSFYGYRFFLQRYRGHKCKFLVRPFCLLGFSSIYYLLFVLQFSKPYKSCSSSCGTILIQALQKFKNLLL